jgi:hypothetical protein
MAHCARNYKCDLGWSSCGLSTSIFAGTAQDSCKHQLAQLESVELCNSSVFIPRHKTWTLISTMFCHAFSFTFCINCQWHGRCKGPPKSHVQYPVLTQEHVLQGSKSKKTGHVCNLQNSVILIAIVVSNKIMFFLWTFFLSQYALQYHRWIGL